MSKYNREITNFHSFSLQESPPIETCCEIKRSNFFEKFADRPILVISNHLTIKSLKFQWKKNHLSIVCYAWILKHGCDGGVMLKKSKRIGFSVQSIGNLDQLISGNSSQKSRWWMIQATLILAEWKIECCTM